MVMRDYLLIALCRSNKTSEEGGVRVTGYECSNDSGVMGATLVSVSPRSKETGACRSITLQSVEVCVRVTSRWKVSIGGCETEQCISIPCRSDYRWNTTSLYV